MRIDFYEVNNFQFVKKTLSVAPFKPGRLCTSASSVLLHIDSRKSSEIVRWLDCSTYPPNRFRVTHLTSPEGAAVVSAQDVCYVAHAGKQILLTTHYMEGVRAFNTATDSLEWTIKGRFAAGMKLPMNARGITADRNGRVFVCDVNNHCVEMFSLDGRFLGNVMKFPAWQKPLRIRYSAASSTLYVCHVRKDRSLISALQVQ